MQWHQGTYREDFLDYVRDAYRGRIKRAGRKLEDRLGQPYATLESQFLAFLREAGHATARGEAAGEDPSGGSHPNRAEDGGLAQDRRFNPDGTEALIGTPKGSGPKRPTRSADRMHERTLGL